MKTESPDSDLRVLDNAIWQALTTHQAHWSIGGDLARRFHPEVSPLAAITADAPENWRALAALTQPGELVMVAGEQTLHPCDEFEVTGEGVLDQMILLVLRDEADDGFALLEERDAGAMAGLVALARPGPYEARTHEMGRYYGLWRDGVLVAMAGERLHVPGHTEISALCVHPEHRGQRYAERLVKFAARQIVARGELPFLHVFQANTGAIALYGKLGFERRKQFHGLTLVRR
ncbi:GNAT family N-acetyltransferase [Burkholderia gladioli]|uniref:GNAT family N-acetyltransferase n=1 Tax=Burkholderia gladioli TaxID=28095 RepID=UPI0016401940|nr:GNAT family N-acetyltransferase [Burkholderia gladioli]